MQRSVKGLFTIIVPNGYGDGETLVSILERDEQIPEKAKYFSDVEGSQIEIFDYDGKGGDVADTLSGKYQIYSLGGDYSGSVILRVR